MELLMASNSSLAVDSVVTAQVFSHLSTERGRRKSMRNLSRIRSVRVHDPNFHSSRAVALKSQVLAIWKPRRRFIQIVLIVCREFARLSRFQINDPNMS